MRAPFDTPSVEPVWTIGATMVRRSVSYSSWAAPAETLTKVPPERQPP
jgi:hypothetical protein